MKTLTPALLLLSALSLAQTATDAAPEKVKVADLLKDGAKYERKVVETSGAVDEFRAMTSKSGNDYFTFTLLDEKKAEAHVFGFGKLDPEPKDGQRVKVTGKFRALKKMDKGDVKNEIDVSPKRGSGTKPAVELLKSESDGR